MSLWICEEHGLYGGGPGCPQCGRIGEWATIRETEQPEPERHAWDDLFDEVRWEGVVNNGMWQ